MLDSDNTVQTYINELLFDGPIEDLSIAERSTSSETGSANKLSSKRFAKQAAIPLKSPNIDTESNNTLQNAAVEKQPDKKSAFLKQFTQAQRGARAARVTRVDHRPEWGKENFSCLLFSVAGLKMAIPIQFIEAMQALHIDQPYIGGVSLPDDIAGFNLPDGTAVGGGGKAAASAIVSAVNDDHDTFYLGKMKQSNVGSGEGVYAVLDTARLVMPERYDKAMQQGYRYALILKGFDWCFAVDSIGDELALTPQSVRWRSEHTRRDWLAGTVVDKMCALVDVQSLDRHLLAERVLS